MVSAEDDVRQSILSLRTGWGLNRRGMNLSRADKHADTFDCLTHGRAAKSRAWLYGAPHDLGEAQPSTQPRNYFSVACLGSNLSGTGRMSYGSQFTIECPYIPWMSG